MIKQMKAMHRSNPEQRAHNKVVHEMSTKGMEKHIEVIEGKNEVFK